MEREQAKLMSETELSSLIGISMPTLKNWRKLGLPHLKVNRLVRYDYEKVIRWMEEKTEEVY